MEKGLKGISDKFLRGIVKTYLEETDRQIAEDKAGREKKGLVVERRSEDRSVYTRFGLLTYSRTYYFDKQKKTYLHPVDMVAGLEAYERVSQTVSADLVSHAAESSYEESSRYITAGEISRQTVMKKIRKTQGLKVWVNSLNTEKNYVRHYEMQIKKDSKRSSKKRSKKQKPKASKKR